MISYGPGRPIELIHVPDKYFRINNKTVMMAVIALTNIGVKNLWEFDFTEFSQIFRSIPFETISEDIKLTPVWIQELIKQQYYEN